MENRYYWLKLKDDFFSSKRVKKLRKMKRGDTYLVIYFKIQLLTVRTQGILHYTGLEDSLAEELALDLSEPLKDIQATLEFLLNTDLLIDQGDGTYLLPFVADNIGTEGSSASRVRKHRENKALQCNADVTEVKQNCYGEIEIEKEIEKDIEIEGDKKTFPPTLAMVTTYCKEAGLTNMDPAKFFDHYQANGWKIRGEVISDWQARARKWDREDAEKAAPKSELDRVWEKVTGGKQ